MRIAYATAPPTTPLVDERFLRPALPSAYLASYLTQMRGDTHVHDLVGAEDAAAAANTHALADLVLRGDPQVVALSTYLWNADETSGLIQLLRKRSSARIVLGGPEVAFDPIPAATAFDADWVCSTEGESPFLNLVDRLTTSPRFSESLPGMIARFSHLPPLPPRVASSSLDHIPSPFRMGFTVVPRNGWVDLETLRGCPYSCAFCLYGKNLSSMRYYSLDRVRDDCEWVVSHGATDLSLLDPTFNLPRRRCSAILGMLADVNQARTIRIHVEARAEAIDESLADALHAAGIESVEVGLQSTNAEALHGMSRYFEPFAFRRGCELLRDRRIRVDIGVIIGLPGDTKESIMRTIDFATSGHLGRVSAYRLQVIPGSEYRRRAPEFGLEYDTHAPYFITRTRTMSGFELAEVCAATASTLDDANASYERMMSFRTTHLTPMEKAYRSDFPGEVARRCVAQPG